MALNARQQEFVNQYLIDYNATRAAERAGYAGSDNTLAVTGHGLLRNPKIAEVIKARLSQSAMMADEVMSRLAEQARGLSSRYVAPDGGVNIELMVADGKTHLIKKIRDTQYGRVYEMYDAQTALRLIGEHHALFTGTPENPQHVVTHTHDEWVADQAKRRQEALAALTDFDDE